MKSKKPISNEIGAVIGKCNIELIKRFKHVNKLRSEAHEMLYKCSVLEAAIWEDVYRDSKIPNGFHYIIDHITRDIMLVGKEVTNEPRHKKGTIRTTNYV
jgi:hypothetical protein